MEGGLLREITVEYVQRVIDANLGYLRQVISSGDIIDRNIFRVGTRWYLIDFEYAHHTLFFFKEAHRTLLNSSWAHDLSLEHLCPFLGGFPTDVAQLLSLAWERHLYAEVLDNRAQQRAAPSLRHRFWSVVDSELAQRLDTHLARSEQHITAKESEGQQLESQYQNLRVHAKRLQENLDQLRDDNEGLRTRVSGLTVESKQLSDQNQSLDASKKNLEAEIDRWRADNHRLSEHAAALEVKVGQQEGQIAGNLAEISQLQGDNERLRTSAKGLEAEVGRLQAEVRKSELQRNSSETELDRLRADDEQLRAHARTLDLQLRQQEAEGEQLRAQANTFEEKIKNSSLLVSNLETEQTRLQDLVSEREAELAKSRTESNGHIAQLSQEIERLRQQLADQERELSSNRQAIGDILASKSWRVTGPLRWGGHQALRVAAVLRKAASALRGKPTGQSALAARSVDRSQDETAEKEIGRTTNLRYHVDRFQIASDPFSSDQFLYAIGWCFAPFHKGALVLELWCDDERILELNSVLTNEDVEPVGDPELDSVPPLARCAFAEQIRVTEGMNHFELRSPFHSGLVLAQGYAEELRIDGTSNGGGVEFSAYRSDGPLVTADSSGPRGQYNKASFDIQTRTMVDHARLLEKPLKVACFTHNLNLEGATKILLDTARGLKKTRKNCTGRSVVCSRPGTRGDGSGKYPLSHYQPRRLDPSR